MAHSRKTTLPWANSLLERLRMGGRKTAVAGALILIMLFMWIRVLVGHRPAAAAAAPPPRPAETPAQRAPVQRTLVELPKLPGRHDAIQRDFFAIQDSSYFRRQAAGRNTGTETEVSLTFTPDAPEVIQRAARMLKLEAVLWSDSPSAFLNDRLLTVGDRLLVKSGAASFEFEVLQIHVDSVLVECRGVQLAVKLAQYVDVSN